MQLYVSFKREAVKILQTGERHHEDRVERDFKIQTFLEDWSYAVTSQGMLADTAG